MFYDPRRNDHNLSHNPWTALVVPRPIGWISSQSKSGQLNLAPYSFFNAFNYDPPILGFASITRDMCLEVFGMDEHQSVVRCRSYLQSK